MLSIVLLNKSAKSLESIKFCRYISWNLAESILPNLISRLLYDRIQPRILLSLSFIKDNLKANFE